jgi:D123
VLKEWYDLLPSMEFRCFVRQRKLLCISQRDTHYYPFLPSMTELILRLATQLFTQIQSFDSENWVFDMYIPRTRRRAHLIDINPFAHRTDSTGYTWREILGMRPGEGTQVRVVTQGTGVGGMEFSAQRVPLEVVEASAGRGVAEFAVEWEEMLRKGIREQEEIGEGEEGGEWKDERRGIKGGGTSEGVKDK